jgi:hypothetical protein
LFTLRVFDTFLLAPLRRHIIDVDWKSLGVRPHGRIPKEGEGSVEHVVKVRE